MDSNHRGERSPRLGYNQMPQPLGYLLTIKIWRKDKDLNLGTLPGVQISNLLHFRSATLPLVGQVGFEPTLHGF